jgi:hypothetical protein
VLSSDFWQDIMADLAHDPGADPAQLLHPAQVRSGGWLGGQFGCAAGCWNA